MQNHIFYTPLEFEAKFNKQKVCCIFGGSFDPIHQGHIRDIQTLLRLADTVIIAPTSQNPWKPDQSSELSIRLEMIEIVLNSENINYSKDIKDKGLILSNEKYNFSIELDELIKAKRDSLENEEILLWAIGEDLRDSAHKWKNWDSAGSDFVVLPTLKGFSGTAIRNNEIKPHPAISKYISDKSLYL